MKKITIIIIAILCSIQLFAQAPQSINYQAVARDASGNIMASQSFTVQINILQGSVSGTAVCSENFSITTNNFGLINLQIGSQNPTAFSAIDWTAGPYFAEVSLNGTLFGTSQLLSVPYALHSNTTDSIVNFSETDPIYASSLAAAITSVDTTNWNAKLETEIDGDTTNEIQTIGRNGLNVTLSNGGGTYTDSVNVYTGGDGIDITGTTVSANSNSILPPGVIMPYAGPVSSIPTGWLLCDGSEVSRTAYADLYSIIGVSYGIGDATTTFNLPDMRGRFLRGVDHGAGIDPDAAARTGNNGGNTGDTVATYQADQANSIDQVNKGVNIYTGTSTISIPDDGSYSSYVFDGTWSVGDKSTRYKKKGVETRPVNISVNYIIKY